MAISINSITGFGTGLVRQLRDPILQIAKAGLVCKVASDVYQWHKEMGARLELNEHRRALKSLSQFPVTRVRWGEEPAQLVLTTRKEWEQNVFKIRLCTQIAGGLGAGMAAYVTNEVFSGRVVRIG